MSVEVKPEIYLESQYTALVAVQRLWIRLTSLKVKVLKFWRFQAINSLIKKVAHKLKLRNLLRIISMQVSLFLQKV